MMLFSFALAAAILIFAGWDAYRSTIKVSAAADARKNSSKVLASLDELVNRVVEAETAERGYVVTGDDSYLQPHRKAVKDLDEILDRLKARTAGEAKQQKHIQELEPLIEKKLARIQEIILLRQKSGLAPASQLVIEGGGKLWMEDIRALIAEMQGEENEQLLIHEREMQEDLSRSAWAIFLGNLAGISLLAVTFVFLITELGEQRRAQKELEGREKWFSTTLGSVGDAVIATDMNGTVTFLNPEAERITGWNLEEARGKSMDLIFDIVNAETRKPRENPVKQVLKEGNVVGLADHTLLLSRDGREFEIEDSAAPIITDAGEGLGVVLVFRDVTEQRRIDMNIQRSEALNRTVVESALDGIIVIDESGVIQSANPAAERCFGWTIEEMIGHNVKMLMPAPYQAAHDGHLREYIETGKKNIIGMVRDVEGMRKNETRFPMHLEVSEMRVGGQRLFVGITRDFTAQKQAEEAIREGEQRLQLALESGQLGAWDLDVVQDRGIRNLRHDQIFGYETLQPEWGVEIFMKHVIPEDHALVREKLAEAMETNVLHLECRIVWQDRSLHWIAVHGRVFRNELGDPVRMLGTIADITPQKNDEEYLVHAREAAEQTSKFKDQFLSTMSHELRTPLNAVLGFSELLTDERYGPLNDRQARYVNHIKTGGKHLLKLINDILDLSKIEAGRMELNLENVQVGQAFTEVLDALQPLADQKKQSLASKVDAKLCVRADPIRFKQVLLNLVGNAIKFTPEGGRIEMIARHWGGRARVEVKDNGPGIPVEEQHRIFETFYRRTHAGQANEGTGLGLAICTRLVEMQGGKLGLVSQQGEGSCFYFSLPLVESAPEPDAPVVTVKIRSGMTPRILVIEEDPAAGHLIESQLESEGYRTVYCDDPGRAVATAAELQPDAITMDMLMDPVHGLKVLLELKRDSRTSRIPVIIISVLDEPKLGSVLGAEEYLVKPVEKSVLLAAVERCLRSRGTQASGRSILVVDDEAAHREMLCELLRGEGYTVDSAEDGAVARSSVDRSLPELVILDLMMPNVSGFDLLAEWRGHPRTANLPVFVLTNMDLTADEEQYIRQHAQSLFHKQQAWREQFIRQLTSIISYVPVE